MKYLSIAVLAFSVFAASCEDPAANKTKATINEPTSNTAANTTSNTATAPAKGEVLAINAENSKVEFTGSKVTGSHEGGFRQISGTIDLVNNNVEGSTVSVEIETASAYSDDEKLTGHLKSADFFDVEKFPKSTFKSTKIVADSAKGSDAFTVTGDFNLHGVTKSISFPATIKVGTDSVTVNADFAINRKDFGIVYAGKADDLIRDDVVIKLDLKPARKK